MRGSSLGAESGHEDAPTTAQHSAGKPVFIFLDVDGVLNSLRTCVAFGGYKTEHLDAASIRLVDYLCGAFAQAGWKPRVVLSSTWRMKHPELWFWAELFTSHGCTNTVFVGVTPDLRDSEPNRRGREIAAWMAANAPGAAYVCLDDDSDFLPNQPLVLTSHLWGLGCDEIDEAFHLVTGQRLFMSTLRTDGKWKAVRAVTRAQSSEVTPLGSERSDEGNPVEDEQKEHSPSLAESAASVPSALDEQRSAGGGEG